MPESNPLNILLTHDRWATRQMLDACGKLTDEQFHQPYEIGPGSLHDTLAHIIGAMQGWGDMLAGREPRPRPEGTRRTAAELVTLFDDIADDLAASARSHPLDEIVSRALRGKMYSFARGGVLTHVTTHGMHHRAQCLNMLRRLGVSPLPASSVLDWMLTADPQRLT